MPYTPMYPFNEDTGIGSPSDIGKPLDINPLPSLADRPRFRSRKDRDRAGQLAAERGRDASSTKPLGHWTQALAQVLEGGLAGYEEGQLAKEDAAYRKYLADALEGSTSPQDLMEQGALYDVEELSDIGKFRSEQDWRQQQAKQAEGWRQKSYDLQREEFDWKKDQPPEGSVPKITDVASMRKEIQNMDSTKRYSAAIPVYNSMIKAGPGKPGDLQIVYGLAKMMDPDSVVRDGEQIMVKKAQSLGAELVGYINALNGGAELLPETRQKLFAEAKTRADAYKQDYEYNLKPYMDIADAYKIDRRYVIPEFAPYGGVEEEFGD